MLFLLFIDSYNKNLILFDEIVLIVFLPTVDAGRITIERIINGESPFKSDRNHFHHYILNFVSNKKYVIWIYFFYVISPIALSLIFKDTKIELIIIISTLFYIVSLKYISKN